MKKNINNIIGKSTVLDKASLKELNFPIEELFENHELSAKYEVLSLNALDTVDFVKKYSITFGKNFHEILENIDKNIAIEVLANTMKDGILITASNINNLFNDNVFELYLVTMLSALIHLQSIEKKTFSNHKNSNHLTTKAI